MDKIKQIKDIMDNFDFEGVRLALNQPIYADYDEDGRIVGRDRWCMVTRDGYKVPTYNDLVTFANKLLLEVASKDDENYHSVRQGPFLAYNRFGIIGLIFNAQSWEGDAED